MSAPTSDRDQSAVATEDTVGARLAANVAAVQGRIRAAGGDPARITVVAVTKGFGPGVAQAAIDAGLCDLGENYAQEMLAKVGALQARGRGGASGTSASGVGGCGTSASGTSANGVSASGVSASGVSASGTSASGVGGCGSARVRWHFLGPVQRNKVAALARSVDCWHSVDRLAVGEAIARRQPGGRVLVQVNASGETSKHGCRPHDAAELVAQLGRLDLDVAGLMVIGPAGPAESARPVFRQVAEIGRGLGLAELSMGMTDDLEVAIQEGATMVRIGRGLFGPRDRMASPATVGS